MSDNNHDSFEHISTVINHLMEKIEEPKPLQTDINTPEEAPEHLKLGGV